MLGNKGLFLQRATFLSFDVSTTNAMSTCDGHTCPRIGLADTVVEEHGPGWATAGGWYRVSQAAARAQSWGRLYINRDPRPKGMPAVLQTLNPPSRGRADEDYWKRSTTWP